MTIEKYDIYDLGYDRSMSKIDSFYDELSRVANVVENGVNPVNIVSGDMSGNYDSSWSIGIGYPKGITTDGINIWVTGNLVNKVYKYWRY